MATEGLEPSLIDFQSSVLPLTLYGLIGNDGNIGNRTLSVNWTCFQGRLTNHCNMLPNLVGRNRTYLSRDYNPMSFQMTTTSFLLPGIEPGSTL